MSHDKRTRFNAQICEEASEWFIDFRLGEIDAAGRREFDAWIRSSPENLRAYLEVAAIWDESDSLGARRELDTDGLIALARTDKNIVPLALAARLSSREVNTGAQGQVGPTDGSSRDASAASASRTPRRYRVWSLAAALAIGILTTVVTLSWQLGRGTEYSTAVGERRVLTLEDGSSIELNSRSRVRVVFSQLERVVELSDGQALFHVAKNPSRPFIVRSDALRVRAVGTAFDVDRRSSGTTVTVVEGRVAVYHEGTVDVASHSPSSSNVAVATPTSAKQVPGNGAILLDGGEQLTVTDQSLPQPQHASSTAAIAWTQGQLVLDSASLAEVAERFNRYSRRRLVTEDHGEPALRLSGVFATDPDFLLHYLRQRPDITLQETPTEVHITRHD